MITIDIEHGLLYKVGVPPRGRSWVVPRTPPLPGGGISIGGTLLGLVEGREILKNAL